MLYKCHIYKDWYQIGNCITKLVLLLKQEHNSLSLGIWNYYLDIILSLSHFISDTFDENTPPSDNPHYISSLGAAIYKGMQSGDSDAVWLMQVSDAI